MLLFPLTFLLACTPGNTDPAETQSKEETAVDTTTAVADVTMATPTDYPAVSTLPKDTTIVPPAGWSSLGMATGDLTKDGLAEKVVVYDTPVTTDFGTARQLYIYQQKDGRWQLWQKINGGILPSENGGMMGDPFEGITIERGTIVITHFGGSRQKWTYTHRFRYQNERWELIGASVLAGAPCDAWDQYDYNLSTGKVEVAHTKEDCDTKKEESRKATYTHRTRPLPQLAGFEPGNNEVKLPAPEEAFYY
ncbi:MAG: hypothetical protein DA408_17500 [Bacteroidetes bacterium]|nr:MAG: hypothetical protein C7N36_08235 [Bacteroidota bacterium]PTM09850.1 MAG: hypothetical protein DA408_17500 [Bacteroidota bacterium]